MRRAKHPLCCGEFWGCFLGLVAFQPVEALFLIEPVVVTETHTFQEMCPIYNLTLRDVEIPIFLNNSEVMPMPLERQTKAKSFKTSGLLCVFTLCLQQTWNWIICKKGLVEWCRMLSVVLMDLSKDFEHALSAVQRNPTQPNQHDIKLSSPVILLGPGQMLHPSLVIQQYLRVDQHPQHRHLMSFGFTVLPETGVCL